MKPKTKTLLVMALTGLLGGALIRRKRATVSIWMNNLATLCEEPVYLFGSLKTPEDLLSYIEKHRSDVSLISYFTDDSSKESVSGPTVFHNADEPMPLASTMKIVVLAAYAREVVAGRLNPEEMIPVQDWDRYYLPDTDGGAHPEALKELGLSGHVSGDPGKTSAKIGLDKIARAMMRESDNAATDYILDRVGYEAVNGIIRDAGLHGQESIPLILGEDLALSNHEHPALTNERLEGLLALSPDQYRRRTEYFARKYLETEWGEVERCSGSIGGSHRNWLHAYHDLTPKGTARDYARIMAEVVKGEFVSSEVSEIMRSHLEWSMQNSATREQFRSLGLKGGSLPGILTYAWYLVPKTGDFAGQPIVVALFMRNMSLSAWERMQRTYAQQEFIKRLATDEEFAGLVEKAV